MQTAIVFISGFREKQDDISGTSLLHADVVRDYASSSVHVFELHPWDTDTKRLAGHLANLGYQRVIIHGYSWGGGFAAQNLASQLAKRGVSIPLMLLCDAIYRPLWLPKFLPANVLSVRSILPGSATIKVPPNVVRVVAARQTFTIPKGHPIQPLSPATKVQLHTLAETHRTIDQSFAWWEIAHTEIGLELKRTPITP